jgi:gliding motility-associated-like protein
MLFCVKLNGVNYYISAEGDDVANTGTSPASPWRTIEKVNLSMALFRPGDSVLFRRGDVFRGQINVTTSGSNGNPIVFGAYGEGAAPVISGGRRLTSRWIQSGTNPNIFYLDTAGFPSKVRSFFADYKYQPLSRFPDTDYRPISDGYGRNSFYDNSITDPDNYWTGGDAVIKTFRWVIDRLTITSQIGGTFNLNGNTTYAINYDTDIDGYFILNHVNAINLPGEWAYNANESRFYYYKPNGVDLDTSVIEASFYDYAFLIDNESDITIQNLDIRYQNSHAIRMVRALHVNVIGNSFSYIGVDGISAYQCSYLKVNNNNFRYIYNNGIRIYALMHVDVGTNRFHEIHGNTLTNIATIPGYGQNDNGQYVGIYFTYGTDVNITNNKLDTVGFNGIHFTHCGNTLIKNNVIKYTNFVKDDGAGIYSWADKGQDSTLMVNNQVIGNLVLNSIGCTDGDFNSNAVPEAYGLYFDDRSRNLTVEGNTSYNSGTSGLLAKGIKNCTFRDNLIYKSVNYAGYFRSSNDGVQPVNNKILYNQFCKDDENKFLEYYRVRDINMHLANTIDSNYLFSPFKPQVVRYDRENNLLPASLWYQYLTLPQWQTFGVDLNAKETPLTFQESQCATREEFIRFEYNEYDTNRVVLLDAPYRDKDNYLITGSIAIKPFSSVLLFKDNRALLEEVYTPRGTDTSFCQGSVTQSEYTTITYPNAVLYQWRIDPTEAADSIVKKNDTTAVVYWDDNFTGIAHLYYIVTVDTGGGQTEDRYSPSLAINVRARPTSPRTSIGPTSLLYQLNQTTTYQVSDMDITMYKWILGPPGVGTINNDSVKTITVSWSNSFTIGTAIIGVRIGNDCGWSDTTEYTISMGSIVAPTGPANVCADSSYRYTTSRIPQANEYIWRIDPEDAGIISSVDDTTISIRWAFDFEGQANVTVIDSNRVTNFGLTSPPLTVNVNPRATAPVSISGQNTIVHPTTSTAYSITEMATAYEWTITAGAGTISNNTLRNITVNWNTAFTGNAVLAVRISNDCGWSDFTRLTIPISRITAPTGPVSVCQGTATSAYTAMSIPQATSFTWQINPSNAGTTSSTTRNATVTWTPDFSGTVNISYTAITSTSNMISPSLTITIIPRAKAPRVITGPDTIIHPNSTGNYTIDTTAAAYRWSLIPTTGTGTIGNASTKTTAVSWNPSFSGDLVLAAQIYNSCGWSDSTKFNVHIDTIAAPTGITEVCQGSSQTYSAMAIPGATSYSWNIDPPTAGSTTSNGRTADISWTTDFGDSARIIFSANGLTSPPLVVSVTPRPNAPSAISGPDSIIQTTLSSDYSIETTAQQYYWIISASAGTISDGAGQNATVVWNPSFIGTALLAVNVEDGCGLSDTTKLYITVESDNLEIPNVFTPNGDGTNDSWEIRNIDLHPEAIITIYNRFNKKIYEFRPSQGDWDGNVDGKPLEIGNYLYIIKLNGTLKPIMGYVTIIR